MRWMFSIPCIFYIYFSLYFLFEPKIADCFNLFSAFNFEVVNPAHFMQMRSLQYLCGSVIASTPRQTWSRSCPCPTKWRITYRRSTTDRNLQSSIVHLGSERERETEIQFTDSSSPSESLAAILFISVLCVKECPVRLGVGNRSQGVLGSFSFFTKGSLEVWGGVKSLPSTGRIITMWMIRFSLPTHPQSFTAVYCNFMH